MAEPTSTASTGLAALIITFAGPLFGPYAVIVIASLAGALWPLSEKQTDTRSAGALFLLRTVGTASFLTGGIAYALETQLGYPSHQTLAPVAFAIGAMGDALRPWVTSAAERLLGQQKEGGGSK